MGNTVFFSWQTDTPSTNGRNFLRSALEEACRRISRDTELAEAVRDLEVDSDTQGVAGQPPIVETIFKKIDGAAVFLADLTFVATRVGGRPSPNPNVLIEYGWALKGLGHKRIICVMNQAYGLPTRESLPFDLGHMRFPICYDLPEDAPAEVRASQKKALSSTLVDAIRMSLVTIPQPAPPQPREFARIQAKDGPARFRAPGEALGLNDERGWDDTSYEIFLKSGPAMWLRLLPSSDQGKRWPGHELQKHIIENSTMQLMPLIDAAGGYGHLRADDGVGMYRSVPQENAKSQTIFSAAFAFETGEIWGIDTAMLQWNAKVFPFLEDVYAKTLSHYRMFLQSIDVPPPYTWVAGVVGVKGRTLDYPLLPNHVRFGPGPQCVADLIEAEGGYDGTESPRDALLPFFTKVFEKCGIPRPDYLSQR